MTTTHQHYSTRSVPSHDIPADAEAIYWIARNDGPDEDVTVHFKSSVRAAKGAMTRDRHADCIERGWKVIEPAERVHGLFAW